jgi:hypothetical protein
MGTTENVPASMVATSSMLFGVLVVDETCDRSVELTVKRQEIGLVPAHELALFTDSRPGFGMRC